MSSDGLRSLHSNHGAKSSPSTDGAVGCRKVTGRSCSTDEGYDGEYVNKEQNKSWAFQYHSSGDVSESGNSPSRDDTERLRTKNCTLPTNIVYGPQDVVRSTEDLQWSNSSENIPSLQEYTFTRNDALNPRILTRGPAKDFIMRNMNRSRSMDEDYGSIGSARDMCWVFPNDGGFSSKDDRKKEVAIPSKEDSRVVTWGIAKTVPVTSKRSSSKDDKHTKKESKKLVFPPTDDPWYVTRLPANEAPVKRVSTKWSSSKDNLYNPGRVEVLPTNRLTRSAIKTKETVSTDVKSAVKISASKDEDSGDNAIKKRGRKPRPKEVAATVKTDKDKKHRAAMMPGSNKRIQKNRDDQAVAKDNLSAAKTFTCGNEKYGVLKVMRSLSTDSGGIQKKWDENAFPKDTLPPVKRFTWANDEYSAPKLMRSVSTDSVIIQGFPKDTLPPVKRFTWGNEDYSAPKMFRSLSTDSGGIQKRDERAKDTLPPVKRFTWANDEYSAPDMIRSISTDSVDTYSFSEDTLPSVKRLTCANDEYSAPKMIRSVSTDSVIIQGFPKDSLPPMKRFTWGSHSADNLAVDNVTDDKTVPNEPRPTFTKFTWRHLDFCATKLIRSFSAESIGTYKKKAKKSVFKDAEPFCTDRIWIKKKKREKHSPKHLTRAEKNMTLEGDEYSSAKAPRWPSTDSIDVQKKRNKKEEKRRKKDAARKRLTSKDEEYSPDRMAGRLSTDGIDIDDHKKNDEKKVQNDATPPEKNSTSKDVEYSATRVARWPSTDSIDVQKKRNKNAARKDATSKMLTSEAEEFSPASVAGWFSTEKTENQKWWDEKANATDAMPTEEILPSIDEECSVARVARWLSTDSIGIQKNTVPKDVASTMLTSEAEEFSPASVAGWLSTDRITLLKKRDEKTVPKDASPPEKTLTSKDEYSKPKLERSLSTCGREIQKKRAERTVSKDGQPPAKILTSKDQECSAASITGWLSTDTVEIQKKRDEKTLPKDASRPVKTLTSKDEHSKPKLERSLSTCGREIQKKRAERTVSKDGQPPAKILTSKDKECSAASIQIQKRRDEKTVPKDASPPVKTLTSKDEHSKPKLERSLSTCGRDIQKKRAERTVSKDAQPPAKILTSKDQVCSAASITGWLSTDTVEIQKKRYRKILPKDASRPVKTLTSKDEHSKSKLERSLSTCGREIQKKRAERTVSKDGQPPAKILTSKDQVCSAASITGWLSTDTVEIQKKRYKKILPKDASRPVKTLTSKDEHSKPKLERSLSTCGREIQKKRAERTVSKDGQPPAKILTSKDKECSAASIQIQKRRDEKTVPKDASPPVKTLTSKDEHSKPKLERSLSTCGREIQKKRAERTVSKDGQPPAKILTSKDKECSAASIQIQKRRDEKTLPKDASPPVKTLTSKDEHSKPKLERSLSTCGREIQKKRAERTVSKDGQPPAKILTSKDKECSAASIQMQKRRDEKTVPKDASPPVKTLTSKDEHSKPKLERSLSTCGREIQKKRAERTVSKDGQPPAKILTSKDQECSAASITGWLSTDTVEIQKKRYKKILPKDASRPVKTLTSKDEHSKPKLERSLSTCGREIRKKRAERTVSKDGQPPAKILTSKDKECSAASIQIQKKRDEKTVPKDASPPVKTLTSKDEHSKPKLERSLSTCGREIQKKRAERTVSKDGQPPAKILTSKDKECSAASIQIQKKRDEKTVPKDASPPVKTLTSKDEHSKPKLERSLSTCGREIQKKRAERTVSKDGQPPAKILTSKDKECSAASIQIQKRRDEKTLPKDASLPVKTLTSKDEHSKPKLERSLSTCGREIQKKRAERTVSKDGQPPAKILTSKDKECSAASIQIQKRRDEKTLPKDASLPVKTLTSKDEHSKPKLERSLSTCGREIQKKRAERTVSKDGQPPAKILTSKDKECSAASITGWLSTDTVEIQKKRDEKTLPKDASRPVKTLTSKDEHSKAKLERSLSTCSTEIQNKAERTVSKDAQTPVKISTSKNKGYSANRIARSLSTDCIEIQKKWDEDTVRKYGLIFASEDKKYRDVMILKSIPTRSIWIQKKRGERTISKDAPPAVKILSSKEKEYSDARVEKWLSADCMQIQEKRDVETVSHYAQTPVNRLASDGMVLRSMVKRSRSMDDEICLRPVIQASRKDISSSRHSSKTKKSGKEARSVSIDSTASSINLADGFESRHGFGEEYFNTGLLNRSRTLCSTDSLEMQKNKAKKAGPKDAPPRKIVSKDDKNRAVKLAGSLSTDSKVIQKKKGEKTVSKDAQTQVKRFASKENIYSDGMVLRSMVKRSRSMDDDICTRHVTPTSHKDISSPLCSSKTKKSKSLIKGARSVSIDSTASSTNFAGGVQSSYCFREECHNTGLLKRSHSMDADICPRPVTQTSRKDISIPRRSSKTKKSKSLGKDARSVSIDSTASSINLADGFESRHGFGEEYFNTGLLNRSRTLCSTDSLEMQKNKAKKAGPKDAPPRKIVSKDDKNRAVKLAGSLSTDSKVIQKKKGEKTVSKDAQTPVKRFASKENIYSDGMVLRSMVKRSRSMDDDICTRHVTPTSHKDISSPLCSSKAKKSKSLVKGASSVSIDSTASSTNLRNGVQSSHCFGEEYYYTGLLKRSHSLDDDICPWLTRASRKDSLQPSSKTEKSKSLGQVTSLLNLLSLQLPADSTATSTNLAGVVESSHCLEDIYYNTGLVRRSRSMDDDIWPGSDTRTSRNDISSPLCFSKTKDCNSLGEEERSLSIDGTENSTNSTGRVESIHHFGEEYLKTGVLKKSRFMDGDLCPWPSTRTTRKDISSPLCSSKTEKSTSFGELARSLSTDSTASSTKLTGGVESSHCIGDKYYNTGLVRRCLPVSFKRKECISLGEVERSMSIHDSENSRNSSGEDGSTHCLEEENYNTGLMDELIGDTRSPSPVAQTTGLVKISRPWDSFETVREPSSKEIPIAVNKNASKDEICNTGNEKRSQSTDGKESVKRVRWASSNLGDVERSLSVGDTENSTNSSKEGGITHCLGEEHYNASLMNKSIDDTRNPSPVGQTTGFVKISRSLDSFETGMEPSSKEILIAGNGSAGKKKRSQSTDGRESVKRVRWASPTELNNYFPCKLQRSVSIDNSEDSIITTCVPKSILKKTQGTIYYDTTKMPRSLSIDELYCGRERSPSEGESFDLLKLLQTDEKELDKNCNPATKTRSKIITWSLRKDDTRYVNHKAPNEHDNSSFKQIPISASKDNVVNCEKGVCSERSDSRIIAGRCETIPGTYTKAACSKTSSETSNAVKRPAAMNDNAQPTKVRRAEGMSSAVQSKSVARNDVPRSVNAPIDTNKKQTPNHDDRSTTKMLPSLSWAEAITVGGRNKSTWMMEKKSAPECESAPSKVERSASSDDPVNAPSSRNDKPSSNKARKSFPRLKNTNASKSKENDIQKWSDCAKTISASKEDSERQSENKSSHSKDVVTTSRDFKRDSGTISECHSVSQSRVGRQCKSAPSKVEKTSSSDDAVNASLSRNDTPSPKRAKKSFPLLKYSNASKSKESDIQKWSECAKTILASKEDSERQSENKSSHSKDGMISSRDSKTTCGTLFDGPSSFKSRDRRPLKIGISCSKNEFTIPDSSDSSSEDLESSSDGSEFGDTYPSYNLRGNDKLERKEGAKKISPSKEDAGGQSKDKLSQSKGDVSSAREFKRESGTLSYGPSSSKMKDSRPLKIGISRSKNEVIISETSDSSCEDSDSSSEGSEFGDTYPSYNLRGNDKLERKEGAKKISPSKEDAGRRSKNKHSPFRVDVSSARDSRETSGTLSYGPSSSKMKDSRPLKIGISRSKNEVIISETSDSSCEDSDSSSEGSEFGDTYPSYNLRGNDKLERKEGAKKISPSKEDAGRRSKNKHSPFRVDVSSARDSRETSGTLSYGPSSSKMKDSRPLKIGISRSKNEVIISETSDSSCEDSDSSSEGSEFGDTYPSYNLRGNDKLEKKEGAKKISPSKEDAGGQSKDKLSQSKGDVSSAREFKRESGTHSYGPSSSKIKDSRPLKIGISRSKNEVIISETSDSSSEDSDSSSEGNEFGDTYPSYNLRGNDKLERKEGAKKISPSKEDAGDQSKNKLSQSKCDVSSARESKRKSGTLSDGPSSSKKKDSCPIEFETSRSKNVIIISDTSHSSCEDSESSADGSEFRDTDPSYNLRENDKLERKEGAMKRTASKEDTRHPSKIQRLHSKDDISTSRESKTESGTVSERPSASKRKVNQSNDDVSSSEDSDSLSEDSESSAEGPEFGNTQGTYNPKSQYKKRSKRESYDCAVCSKSFNGKTDLRRHHLIHADEKPHVCEICHKSYRQNVNLRNHMKVEHFKAKEFECPFCMKPFALKLRLKLHMRVHIGEKKFVCPKCPKTFNDHKQLAHHLKSHGMIAENTCDVCNVTCSSERYLRLHMERHAAKDNLCLICKATFESETAMRSHMSLSHSNLKHFECQICEKQIQDDLDTHMKTHAVARRHECEVCKKVFAQKTQYNIHMRTHTGERPFQCRVCWQNFGHSNVLKLHIRKHTGEKPFKCVHCKDTQQAFSQLAHLKTHLKKIHDQDTAYICEDCKQSFKKKFHLDAHVKTCEKAKFDIPTKEEEKFAAREAEELAQLRYLMAVLLKKISSREKLAILGFEKRLIDNVVIAALKLSGNKAYDSKTIHPLDQMKLNIQTFLEWTVPENIMHQFKMECPSIEVILEKIVSLYLNQQR